jgi:hypothetical protein
MQNGSVAPTNIGLGAVSYTDICKALMALDDAGLRPNDLAKLHRNKALCKKAALLIRTNGLEMAGVTSEVFTIGVNYDQRVEQIVKSGGYATVDVAVSTQNFPTTRHGIHQVDLLLFDFRMQVSSDDAILMLDLQGCRPAEAHELLTFGSSNPAVVDKMPIVGLGSILIKSSGDRLVLCLDNYNGRDVKLDLFEKKRGVRYRFAAIRSFRANEPRI